MDGYNFNTFKDIQDCISDVLAFGYSDIDSGKSRAAALTKLSAYTHIGDYDWLFEVFSTGAALTAEDAVKLYQEELEENAAPFKNT